MNWPHILTSNETGGIMTPLKPFQKLSTTDLLQSKGSQGFTGGFPCKTQCFHKGSMKKF